MVRKRLNRVGGKDFIINAKTHLVNYQTGIYNLLNLLNKGTACGVSRFVAKPVKAVSRLISALEPHKCNSILEVGVFPDRMKIVRVCVLHRG